MIKRILVLGTLLMSLASGAFAGTPSFVVSVPGGAASQRQTTGYAGLVWTLGKAKSPATPEVVVGARSLKVNSNDHVNKGADLSVRFGLANGFALDSTRLSYVGGQRDLLGNAGLGYSFARNSMLTTLAVQGPYSRLGMDYDFAGRTVLPYAELNSAKKPKKVNEGSAYACSGNFPEYSLPATPTVGASCVFTPI